MTTLSAPSNNNNNGRSSSTSAKNLELILDDELIEFLRMVQGATDARMADGWSGLRANEIAQAVYRSTKDGDRVVLSTRDV